MKIEQQGSSDTYSVHVASERERNLLRTELLRYTEINNGWSWDAENQTFLVDHSLYRRMYAALKGDQGEKTANEKVKNERAVKYISTQTQTTRSVTVDRGTQTETQKQIEDLREEAPNQNPLPEAFYTGAKNIKIPPVVTEVDEFQIPNPRNSKDSVWDETRSVVMSIVSENASVAHSEASGLSDWEAYDRKRKRSFGRFQ